MEESTLVWESIVPMKTFSKRQKIKKSEGNGQHTQYHNGYQEYNEIS